LVDFDKKSVDFDKKSRFSI